MTAGRLWSLVAALSGLTGVIIGARTLARSKKRTTTGRRGPITSLATGTAATTIGALVIAAAEGGPGTGYGIVGGYVAVAVGLTALLLGGLSLTRPRHTTHPDRK
ncbi:DUF6223 family protein [Kibdelosporangium banguiense]|nr:DUF6223 family protein [Kibdelosporangium banguiense]